MGSTFILHASDVHCRRGAFRKLSSLEDFDILAFTGDFECIESVEELLSLPVKVLAVTGNVDHASIYRLLVESGAALDGRTATVAGLTFAGVGGIDPSTSIKKLDAANQTIHVLLSHHPPYGILDVTFYGNHAGLEALRDLVLRVKPRLHLFGHIHESRGSLTQAGVTFVNPGPLREGFYALIEIKGGEVVRVSLKELN